MQIQVPLYVQTILETIEDHGYKAYLVGGCVRDALLGKDPYDFDLCTSALPETILSLFPDAKPTGREHGTMTVQGCEITTLRKESDYFDHRHPSTVTFTTSIQEDLCRRDFTINAMAYHLKQGLIDPFSGLQDLKAGIIRCVNDPYVRLNEDALRLFRAYRFCARLHFAFDSVLEKALHDLAYLSKYVSFERMRYEVTPILFDDPYMIKDMVDLLEPFIKELVMAKGCMQNTSWHDKDVLDHTLCAIDTYTKKDPLIAWTLLFHDLGKVYVKSTKDGIDHFYGHQKVSKQIANNILPKMGFSKSDIEHMCTLILRHDESLACDLNNAYRYCIEWNHDYTWFEDFLTIRRCDLLAHSKKGQQTLERLDAFASYMETIYQDHPRTLSALCVNGKDIQDQFGLEGIQIKHKLQGILRECFFDPSKNTRAYWLEGK